jgi:hypothetical protein
MTHATGARTTKNASVYAMAHNYISTACYHDLHAKCRLDCKWCEEKCDCYCHYGVAVEKIALKGDHTTAIILKLYDENLVKVDHAT